MPKVDWQVMRHNSAATASKPPHQIIEYDSIKSRGRMYTCLMATYWFTFNLLLFFMVVNNNDKKNQEGISGHRHQTLFHIENQHN